MADTDYRPGRITWFSHVRTAVFYVYIALATLALGTWGLIFKVPQGRPGATTVATVWARHLVRAADFFLGLRCEVRGTLPAGDLLIGAKHQSFFDILVLAQLAPERAFIMKKQILNVPIMGWFAYKAGCIPIDRARGSEAMKVMLEGVQAAIARGLGQLIVYPEGTRTAPGSKRRYKPGIGVLAENTGLPVVPVATNVGLFWDKRGWPIKSGVGILEFLPTIEPGLNAQAVMARLEAEVEAASDALMAEAGFTPPAERG